MMLPLKGSIFASCDMQVTEFRIRRLSRRGLHCWMERERLVLVLVLACAEVRGPGDDASELELGCPYAKVRLVLR